MGVFDEWLSSKEIERKMRADIVYICLAVMKNHHFRRMQWKMAMDWTQKIYKKRPKAAELSFPHTMIMIFPKNQKSFSSVFF